MQTQNTTELNTNKPLFDDVDSVAMIGLGATGRSCLQYLNNKDVDLIAMDSRTSPPDFQQTKEQFPQVEFIKGELEQQLLIEADLIVISPGVPLTTPEIKHAHDAGVPVVGDIELFAHEVEQPVISITGSNGKSTVTALCGAMLKAAGFHAQVGGNFGEPALDLLSQLADFYVLELSSFQLETTYKLNSQVAVILNVTPDHMDRYDTLQAYSAAKHRIYNRAVSAVYNRADPLTVPTQDCFQHTVSFALDEPQSKNDFGILQSDKQSWLCQGQLKLVNVNALQIKGSHNQLNALAALAICYLVGADLNKAIEGLINFTGLPHRFESVGTFNGAQWINDSKGTNPGATLASISGQTQPLVLILGGDSKGADFSVLTSAINDHVKAVVLFGRDTDQIKEIVPQGIACRRASSLKQAIQMADEFAAKDDMVLYSPACASFDMFTNYMQRGDAFKQHVVEYFQ